MAKSKKVNKWDAAPENIGKVKHDLTFLLDRLEVQTYNVDDPEYKELVDDIFKSLDKALDDYNELEAKHNADCGLISEYEEENKNLKSKLDIMTDENDCLIARVFKQDEEYTKLNEELYEVKKEREDLVKKCAELEKENAFNKKMQTEYCDIIEARLNQQYHKSAWQKVRQSKCESKDDALQKMIKEVAELEKEKIDLEVQLAQSDDLRYRAAKYSWAIKTVLRKASFSPGHIAEELRFMARKSTTPKDVQERWETYANEFLGEHSKFVDEINRLEKKIETLEAKNEKLEEKHEKATRYISRLTEALNNAGVEFHWVKIGDDGEEVFYVDSVVDKLAKKHYEAQYNNLRDVIRERNDIILHLESKIIKLEEFLKKKGRPVKYGKDATWCWDFEDGAWDESEERVAKLVSALDKCHMDARWDRENGKWCIYVRSSNTEITDVSFDICEFEKAYDALKKKLNAIYGYHDTDNPCGICKNFDPKE